MVRGLEGSEVAEAEVGGRDRVDPELLKRLYKGRWGLWVPNTTVGFHNEKTSHDDRMTAMAPTPNPRASHLIAEVVSVDS